MSKLMRDEEIDLLRRKARRRLVGAIFLLIVAIGLCWKSFDREPQKFKPELVQVASPLSDQLPTTQNTSGDLAQASLPVDAVSNEPISEPPKDLVPSKVAQSLPQKAQKTPPEKVAKTKITGAKTSLIEHVPSKTKIAEKPKQKTLSVTQPAEPNKKEAPKKMMIQLAALANQQMVDALKKKLAALGIHAYFTAIKTTKGEIIRVRIGPFSSHTEADAMLKRLSQHGLSGTLLP